MNTTEKGEKEEILSLRTSIEIIKEKYTKAIEAVELNGKLQKIMFVFLIMLHFTSCLILTAFPLQKELPDYVCINKFESFENPEDNAKYFDKSKFTVIKNEECIKNYCIDKNKDTTGKHVELWFMAVDNLSVRNFITMFDLICDIEGYSGNFARTIFIGRIFGTIIFSYLSDSYGRKRVLNLILICMVVSNIGFLLVVNKHFYLIFGYISNIAKYSNTLVYIIAVESMGLYLYSHLSGMMGFFFSFCGLFNLAIITFFRDWLLLIFLHTIINIALCAISFKYIYETPQYLLGKKEYSNLNKVLIETSIINGTEKNLQPILDSIKLDLQDKNYVESNKTDATVLKKGITESILGPYLQLFKMRKDLEIAIKLLIPFLSLFLVYYGQLMYVEKLPGGVKSNTLFILVAETLTPLVNGYLLQNYSRKKILIGVFSLSIFASLIAIVDIMELLSRLMIFINAFLISVGFNTIYTFSAEVFDSSIKSSANGLLIIFSNIGMIFSDFLISIFDSPFYSFGIFCFLSILSIVRVPETFKPKI